MPPQDSNWNFSDYLYRYDPAEFTTNPVSKGVGNRSALYKAFIRPGSVPNSTANGTGFYFVNYTTPIALGINSSIMTAQGYIPGLGSFIQDSTTPSFSFGLGYCALPRSFALNNVTVSVPDMVVNRTGTYDMAGGTLQPIAAPATPQLVNAACSIGAFVIGSGIAINCNGGVINDTTAGIVIVNSTNISVNNCRVQGNGVRVVGSSGVTFNNLTLEPTAARDFGVNLSDVNGVSFFNLSIGKGYNSTFSVFSSSGTPFSEGVEVYNISICGQDNLSAVRQLAFIYSYKDTCASGISAISNLSINPVYELLALTLALLVAYAYIFMISRRRRGPRAPARRRGK